MKGERRIRKIRPSDNLEREKTYLIPFLKLFDKHNLQHLCHKIKNEESYSKQTGKKKNP